MTADFSLPRFDLQRFVEETLAEDLGGRVAADADITARACFDEQAMLRAELRARGPMVVAGLPVAAAIFRRLDGDALIEPQVADGAAVAAGAVLMRVAGKARALLAAERSALNIAQHLTGIATLTRAYVDRIAGTGATLLDTRKTLPGLRALEKYAVRMGGGVNHRMGLFDQPMVKDNHVAAAGSIGAAVAACRKAGLRNITAEVDALAQIEEALAAGADRLLLDNMDPPMLAQAVALVAGRVPTEASGGINLETIRAVAASGVSHISVGRLTQSAPAADIGMDYSGGDDQGET